MYPYTMLFNRVGGRGSKRKVFLEILYIPPWNPPFLTHLSECVVI